MAIGKDDGMKLRFNRQETVDVLIAAKADVNAKGIITALMSASSNGYKEIVDVLIAAKVDVNVKDKNGVTALTEI